METDTLVQTLLGAITAMAAAIGAMYLQIVKRLDACETRERKLLEQLDDHNPGSDK